MKRVGVQGSGFTRFLEIEPLTVWGGVAELTVAVRDDMTQHHGFAHGAVVGAMADNACAWAASSVVGDVVTGNYTINFLNPARGTHLRARGEVAKAGRRQAVVRAEVWAETEGEAPVLAAVATATIIPTGR
jgi:uncharacterized protein (TIGR00369 family)